jgi:hypothetical protein
MTTPFSTSTNMLQVSGQSNGQTERAIDRLMTFPLRFLRGLVVKELLYIETVPAVYYGRFKKQLQMNRNSDNQLH